MAFDDKTLQCSDCGVEFVFTASEQEFYASKGFTNEPRRCTSCRSARKAERYGGGGGGGSYGGGGGGSYGGGGQYSSGPRQMFTIACAQCGKDAEVPFQPRQGRPVYCSDCYSKNRSGSGSGGGSRW